jgi:bifunctional non-homologous end joining protein LigD
MPDREIKAHFIEPMLLLRTEKLPQGGLWVYELKLDGFRAEAIKSSGRVHLRSRNDKDFNARYPAIVQALAAMPDETVIDGEIVALDESGRPSFNALQNLGSSTAALFYYVFDMMILAGKDVMHEPVDRAPRTAARVSVGEIGRADPRIARVGRKPARVDSLREGAGA